MQPFHSSAPTINTKTIGTGKSLVFLHGFLEDHSIWNRIYSHFVNDGFQCILIDLPCHGLSRFSGEICTMKEMANAVFNYLQEKKIENPFVLGHSMGGYVGLELLRQIPIELTLIHSNFWEDPESKKLDRNRVIEIVKTNKSLFLSESIPHLFAPENRITNQLEIENLIQLATKIPVNEICASTAGLRDRRSAYDLMEAANINLIHGNQDPIIPNGILSAALQKLTKKPNVFKIENCGHMSFIEQPQSLINHLSSILFQ